VTTIGRAFGDSSALVRWAADTAYSVGYAHGQSGAEPLPKGRVATERVRDEAGAVGTQVHDAIEATVHGEDPAPHLDDLGTEAMRAQAHAAYGSWRTWWDREGHAMEWLATEWPLLHERWRYGGTVDAVAMRDGELLVVDWKTSRRTYTAHIYQCAAYALAWEAMTGAAVAGCVIVRADKAGGKPGVYCPPEAIWAEARRTWPRRVRDYYVTASMAGAMGLIA
jgi:hypothetical protein